MNPLWLLTGIAIGDRLIAGFRDERVARAAKKVVRETYWAVEGVVNEQRLIGAYHRFLHELPTTTGREGVS